MAYKMTMISEKVRVGQKATGEFDIEVWPDGYGNGEMESILLPENDAEEVAKYLLKRAG